ncbi:MAG: hypothetical protein KA257_08150 [Opitutaceae bacterium]|nr:hypothetical protein [Opitutaceae bacterium]MBP9913783.1 hypothetical protein [Opitutaceae bacterium]
MNPPNTLESVQPCSGQYSLKKDLRLNAWFAVATGTYLVTIFLLRHHPDWSVSLRVAVTLAPLIPGFLYVRSCLRFVKGMDELQRRIQLEAWLFAAMGTVLVGTVLSALSNNGVDLGSFKHGLDMGRALALLFVLWLVGSGLANRRYK